jgi:hypothetical protein
MEIELNRTEIVNAYSRRYRCQTRILTLDSPKAKEQRQNATVDKLNKQSTGRMTAHTEQLFPIIVCKQRLGRRVVRKPSFTSPRNVAPRSHSSWRSSDEALDFTVGKKAKSV